MQKKLIALAVAGLASSAAFAQVTVYGVADAGVYNTKGTTHLATIEKKTGVNSGNLSGSRVGFNASEDLGNGLSAVALIEAAVTLDQGSGAESTTSDATGVFGIARQSYVGLKSASVGEIRLGRQYSAASAAVGAFDAQASSPTFSVQAALATYKSPAAAVAPAVGGVLGMDVNSDIASGGVRHDNTIGYISPSIGGAVVSASYSFDKESSTHAGISTQTTLSAAVTYTAGPLSVGGMMTSREDVGDTAVNAAGHERSDLALGLSYDLGVAKLFGVYQTLEAENMTAAAQEAEATIITLGANIPLGTAGSVQLQYGDAEFEQTDAGLPDGEASGTAMSATYRHALSKRTTAYAGFVTKKFKEEGALAAGASEKSETFAVGMRHTF